MEWAASRPWSNGKVALYGKSYDALDRPDGARAAPARPRRGRLAGAGGRRLPLPLHEPRPLPERGCHPGALPGHRRQPGHPQRHAGVPVQQRVGERGQARLLRATTSPTSRTRSPSSAYWSARNLVRRGEGQRRRRRSSWPASSRTTRSPTPSSSCGTTSRGTENRAWFGQWDHVRGNDRARRRHAPRRPRHASSPRRCASSTGTSRASRPPVDRTRRSSSRTRTARFRGETAVAAGRRRGAGTQRCAPARTSTRAATTAPAGTRRDTASAPTRHRPRWSDLPAAPHRAHLAGTPRI